MIVCVAGVLLERTELVEASPLTRRRRREKIRSEPALQASDTLVGPPLVGAAGFVSFVRKIFWYMSVVTGISGIWVL